MTGRVVDCSLHPLLPAPAELKAYLEDPWRTRGFSYGFQQGAYRPPIPAYATGPVSADDLLPASEPAWVVENVLDPRGVDQAVLVPLTFGLMPEIRFDSAVASATNRWLVERWLDHDANCDRFRGSIRVNPRDVTAAIEEIETWGTHPKMVQVVVPLEAHVPYGQEIYFPLWEAVSATGLPLAFHSDGWGGALLPPTAAGYPSFYLEAYTLLPMLALVHLGGLIAEGVLDRLPGLRLVFADGGFGLLEPSMWRVDRVWRSLRFETPWISSEPSSYIRERVRVVLHDADLVEHGAQMEALLGATGGAEVLLYGSNYPFWDDLQPVAAAEALPASDVARVMSLNADEWYNLARSAARTGSTQKGTDGS